MNFLTPAATAALKAIGDSRRPPTDAMLLKANQLCDRLVLVRWNEFAGLEIWTRCYQIQVDGRWQDVIPPSLSCWAHYIEEVRRDGSGWVHKNRDGLTGHLDKATRELGRRLRPESSPTWHERILNAVEF